ncbi:MAG: excinuclease ABC subunit UvrC [Bacteroidota bacterium]|nr:excinuclease ABC subunit UvrC [Bacteroidota bacterium]MDE2644812.1 excinuclease ABC subunit UvrC [Bacteroidota bacterium]MXW32043.1 excinuclease ABC subunit C [Rhodothermaceae bacterium]MYE62017.1 excinuclease ABC subunit C [Rhodothermaceae bacterium]MYJ19750.1 excinuclease ABC subunit C [Rhodothermaceae bacterium]
MGEPATNNDSLQTKVSELPTRCGVYQFLDENRNPLYIGKAINLRSRVRSYFRKDAHVQGRIRLLIAKAVDVQVIVTDNEAEALILENNLIKERKPRYNIVLRDGKTYPYICIKKEPFPRVFITRRILKDGSKYFGPYTDVGSMRRALGIVRSIFKLRTCSLDLSPEPIQRGKYQVCLEFHIKKCAGPCVGYQSAESYDQTVAQVEMLLKGHTSALKRTLQDAMQAASEQQQYEEAARIRNQIDAIETYAQRQKVVTATPVDRDLFALATARDENAAVGVCFKVREGKIIGREHKIMRQIEGHEDSVLMQRYLENYYTQTAFFPEEVFLNIPTSDPEALVEFLTAQRGKKVLLITPQRGQKAELMRMVQANADLLLGEFKLELLKRGEDRIPFAVKALQSDLRLSKLPKRIECFDISHLGGTGTVASCIVFHNGRPRKSDYRSYKIRGVLDGKPDDFLSMEEVIRRRFQRIQDEDGPWPDLVVVDGGKGQLSSAIKALKKTDTYGNFPVIGLSKRLEEVYFPEDKEPYHIAKQSASLQLIQRVRDEAHRFAVNIQRKQRKSRLLHSELLDIPGVGPKTVQKLIRAFGSVRKIKHADQKALKNIVGPSLAKQIEAYFSKQVNVP